MQVQPNKELILNSLTAMATDAGRPPSRREFTALSGISEHHISYFFPTWSDAVRAAGLQPYIVNTRLKDRELLADWAYVVRRLGKIPARRAYRHLGQFDRRTFERRFGPWSKLPEVFRKFARGKPEWADVLALLPRRTRNPSRKRLSNSAQNPRAKAPSGATPSAAPNPAVAQVYLEPRSTLSPAQSLPSNLHAASEATPSHTSDPPLDSVILSLARDPGVIAAQRQIVPAATIPASPNNAPAPNRQSPTAPSPCQRRFLPLRGRPTYGQPMDFRGLRHEPVNEQGVVLLFGMVAKELGYIVESVQSGFPDCEAKRQIAPQRWQRVHLEFEFASRNYRDHGHPLTGCDIIVCWRHNWPNHPAHLEILELSSLLFNLPTVEA